MAEDVMVKADSEVVQITLTDTCIQGDLIAYNGTNWVRADADATQTLLGEYIALQAARESGAVINVCRRAYLFDPDAPFTLGGLVYLSATVGKFTPTVPTIANTTTMQVVGKGLSTTRAYLNMDYPHIVVQHELTDTRAATGANYDNFFVADRPMRLIVARFQHRVLGTDAGAVTVTLEKLTGTTALDSGVNMLSTTHNLKATINTPVAIGPSTTVADVRLDSGDRVALLDSGVLTAVAGLVVTAVFVPGL